MSSPGSTPPPDKGSRLKGFLLGWAAIFGGVIANMWFWGLQNSLQMRSADILAVTIGSLPLLAPIALMIWFASQDKPRSAIGVLLAFGSLIALVLLLVAACFGLLVFNGGFGNMH